jgi:sugar-phosphatase
VTPALQSLLAHARALLVDLDGTLVDSSPPVTRAWTAFAYRHGLDPDEVLRFAHGRPSRDTVAALLPPDGDVAAEADLLERTEVNDTEGVRALPGAAALTSDPGIPLAIVTSCSRALATARLRAASLPLPKVIVGSDEITHGKPDPEPFRLGAERLAIPIRDCLALEDAPAGIAAAQAAGARVIAVRTTHGDGDLQTADLILDDLDEVAAALVRYGLADRLGTG